MSRSIPAGWNLKTLDECISSKPEYGANASAKDFSPKLPRYVRITDITEDGHLSNVDTKSIAIEDGANYYLAEGDFLFARTGASVGKTYLYCAKDGVAAFAGYLIRYRVNKQTLRAEFLFQYTHSSEYWNWVKSITRTGAQPNINAQEYSSILLPIPPLPEQRKIAEILSSADRSIEATEKLIAKLADLKKALMQQLLTQGIGHTEFKPSPLGKIPKDWEVVKLEDIIDQLDAGVSVNSEDRNARSGEIGIMKTSCVNGGIFNALEHKVVISADVSRTTCHVKKDSIIISRMNTPELVGENAYVDHDYDKLFLPDRLWQTITNPRIAVSVKWLSYILQSTWMKTAISGIATGTSGSMKNISKPVFLALETVSPPFPEQRQIADILSGVDRKLSATKAKLAKAKDLKQGLMNDLLTGKVRVTI